MFILNSNDTVPLYEHVYNHIREHVLSRKLPRKFHNFGVKKVLLSANKACVFNIYP